MTILKPALVGAKLALVGATVGTLGACSGGENWPDLTDPIDRSPQTGRPPARDSIRLTAPSWRSRETDRLADYMQALAAAVAALRAQNESRLDTPEGWFAVRIAVTRLDQELIVPSWAGRAGQLDEADQTALLEAIKLRDRWVKKLGTKPPSDQ